MSPFLEGYLMSENTLGKIIEFKPRNISRMSLLQRKFSSNNFQGICYPHLPYDICFTRGERSLKNLIYGLATGELGSLMFLEYIGNPWRSGRDFSGMVGIPGIIGSDGLRKIWKRPPFFTVTAGMGMWFGQMDGDTKSCKTFKVFECITVFFVRIKSIKLTLCQVVIFNYRDHKKTAGSIQHLLGGFRLATRGRESFQVFQLYKPITPQMEANHSEVLGEQSSFWISWTPPGWFVCSCWKFFETFPPDILESSFQKKNPSDYSISFDSSSASQPRHL